MAGSYNSGRKPLPSAIKKRCGTYRQKQLDEPQPESGWPECPPHITGVAATAWDEVSLILDKMGVLTKADGLALELLLVPYARYRQACEEVQQSGSTVPATRGGVKVSPWVTAMNKNWEQARKMLIEFGLTPAARTRVGMATSMEPDPVEEFLRTRDGRN